MLHQPSKFHSNPLSHFLSLHSAATTSPPQNSPTNSGSEQLDIDHPNTTPLDVVNGNIGKSFTIAAILGLKKNVGIVPTSGMLGAGHNINGFDNNNTHNYSDVMNLSLNNQGHNKNCSSSTGSGSSGGSNYETTNNHLLTSGGNCISRLPTSLVGQHFGGHPYGNNHQSALQSLQQLQQQHSAAAAAAAAAATNHQLNNTNRDKTKGGDNSNKKSSLKSKRVRTIFTPEQLERLEAEFERQQYMVGPERLYLAHTLQLTEAQVKVWFQNRRIKWRKHHLELTQQRLAIIRQRQLTATPQGSNSNMGGLNLGIQTVNHQQMSQHDSELSVCTDSMDAGSGPEGDES